NVLEHMVADDDIEARIRLGDLGDVAMLHRMRRIEVHAQVVGGEFLQPLSQSRLRRDVEDVGAGRNPVAEPHPEDAMALERAAVWTARVRAAAMWGNPARRPFAHWT